MAIVKKNDVNDIKVETRKKEKRKYYLHSNNNDDGEIWWSEKNVSDERLKARRRNVIECENIKVLNEANWMCVRSKEGEEKVSEEWKREKMRKASERLRWRVWEKLTSNCGSGWKLLAWSEPVSCVRWKHFNIFSSSWEITFFFHLFFYASACQQLTSLTHNTLSTRLILSLFLHERRAASERPAQSIHYFVTSHNYCLL